MHQKYKIMKGETDEQVGHSGILEDIIKILGKESGSMVSMRMKMESIRLDLVENGNYQVYTSYVEIDAECSLLKGRAHKPEEEFIEYQTIEYLEDVQRYNF